MSPTEEDVESCSDFRSLVLLIGASSNLGSMTRQRDMLIISDGVLSVRNVYIEAV